MTPYDEKFELFKNVLKFLEKKLDDLPPEFASSPLVDSVRKKATFFCQAM